MAKNIVYAYRAALDEIMEGLQELMADLEDIRDEAQDLLDDGDIPAVKKDVQNMDEALRFLDHAADALSKE